MKKFWDTVAKDLWIVLLDILAVNLSYFLALLIRFYVNFEFRPTVTYYLTDFYKFTPFYTVVAIIIFVLFKLYGGMWRYAGINDMNRIIGANACTIVVQIVGTALFVRRMPISYYVIGAILQFFFIVLIRFGYRLLLVEKKKIADRKSATVPSVIIGAGETARKTIRHLEENTAFRPVAIVDEKEAGKSFDGIPVTIDLESALNKGRAVFIANPKLSDEKRAEIKHLAEEKGLELQDYTGYLANLGGRVPLTAVLELTRGPVSILLDGKEKKFESGEEALKELTGRYEVAGLEGTRIELKKPSETAYIGYEAWAREHKENTGEEVSFF